MKPEKLKISFAEYKYERNGVKVDFKIGTVMMKDKIYWKDYHTQKTGSFSPKIDIPVEETIDGEIFQKYEFFDYEIFYFHNTEMLGFMFMFQVTKETYTHNRGMVVFSANKIDNVAETVPLYLLTKDEPRRNYHVAYRGNEWHFKMMVKFYKNPQWINIGAYKDNVDPKKGRETFFTIPYPYLKKDDHSLIEKIHEEYLIVGTAELFNSLFKTGNAYEKLYRTQSQNIYMTRKTMFGQMRDSKSGEIKAYMGTKRLAKLVPDSNEFDLSRFRIFNSCGGHNCLVCSGNNGVKFPAEADIKNPMAGCDVCLGSRKVVHFIPFDKEYPKIPARYFWACSSDVVDARGDCDPTKEYECFYEKKTLQSDNQGEDIGYKIPIKLSFNPT